MTTPTIFGIDYDGTWSRDHDGFELLVKLLQSRGHICVVVTQRCNTPSVGLPVRDAVRDLCPIVWASRMDKRHAARCAGYDVDIWIEDNPSAVYTALHHKDCP